MAIYFTADTHFGSERTLKFSRRPFISVFEMDSIMVRNWNKLVTPDDEIFHLGDFGDFTILKHLNGKITLIPGNYERDDKNLNLDDYVNDKFRVIYTTPIDKFILTVKQDEVDYNFELVHEPSNAKSDNFVLFGHVHEKCTMKRNGLNVGVDCHHFKPIGLDTILFYEEAIIKYYDNEVWSSMCGVFK